MLNHFSRRWSLVAVLGACALASRPASAQGCVLEYQRADNMWAAFGRPDGNLGTESIALAAGNSRNFVTDWKYEKTRNDGTNYFGSHLRIVTNKGTLPVVIEAFSATIAVKDMVANVMANVRQIAWNHGEITIPVGTSRPFRADLMLVRCPKA